jgi:hypothetical protein
MKSNRSNAVADVVASGPHEGDEGARSVFKARIGRFALILVASSLGLSACSHNYALNRRDEAAMLNDSPAISPWMGPVPNEVIQPDDRIDAREPGDEE